MRTQGARTHVFAQGPRPDAGESGFTIIEVMIALLLLAIGSLAMASVFYAGLRTASISSIRSEASALATRETEAIRAVPYAGIGFYDDQGPSSAFGTPVSLGATTPGGTTPRIQPTGTAVVGVKTFAIARHVVKATATGPASATYANAYKRTVVVITWSDSGGAHTIKQDSVVYPGGQGAYAGAPTSTTSTTPPAAPGAPVLTTVTPPPDPAGRTQLDATWSAPTTGGVVSYYIVQYSTSAAFNSPVSSPQQPSSARAYQASGLASDTRYYFQVFAYSATGSPSPASNRVSELTLSQPAPPPCTVTTLAVTGTGTLANQGLTTKTYLQAQGSNYRLDESLSLTVSYSGACTGTFSVSGVLTSSGAADPGSAYSLSGAGSTRTGTIPEDNSSWSVGSHTFTALQNGATVSPAVTKTLLFCAPTASPSASGTTC